PSLPVHPQRTNSLDGLNPQQRQAVVHEGSPLLIVAGAKPPGPSPADQLARRPQPATAPGGRA
ncbi:hypothetical protein GR254_25180, partial [Mycobacterium tuberculosis]|nr:hypothetical protein [Mycobacterium tuberculosis]